MRQKDNTVQSDGSLTWVDGKGGRSDDSVTDTILSHALVFGVILARFGRLYAQHRHQRLRDDHVAGRLR